MLAESLTYLVVYYMFSDVYNVQYNLGKYGG